MTASIRRLDADASEDGTGPGTPFIINAAESCAVVSHARPSEVARCLDSTGSFASNQGGTVVVAGDFVAPVQALHLNVNVAQPPAIAFQERGRKGGRSIESQTDLAYSLNAPSGGGRRQEMNVATRSMVRRLTPVECEKLQGFSEDWTLVPYRGKLAADGPRYKAIGNSMAVPVVRWIGERIDQLTKAN